MAKGKTLWEMLMEKLSSPTEFKFYNPLRARIGSSVMVNTVELRDLNFFVREIRQYSRRIRGREYLFADYVLLARPLHGDEVQLRLRLNPVDEPDRAGGLTHHALLLRLYDEMAYNEGLHQVVTDTTKKFQILEDGQVKEEYFRLHDVAGAYTARVSVIQDVNKDGKVQMDEVKQQKLEYWDYGRQVPDAAGQSVTQYLFVEMDKDNGWFQLWRGEEIDPQQVLVI